MQTFAITLPQTRYATPPQRAAFVETLISRIEQLPDVVSAGAVFGLPFQNFRYGISVSTIDGRRLSDDEQDRLTTQVRAVTPGYFSTVGMTIVRGRGINAADRLGSEPVVVLSETAAKRLWPNDDPIGRHFTIGSRMGQGGANAGGTVVGIVGDIHDLQPGLPVRPSLYLAHAQFPVDGVSLVARSRNDPTVLIEPMRALLAALDPNVPMFRVRTMEQLGADVVSQPRLYATLLGGFAIVSALLSALGLYGMLAYLVSQRTREIAIRLALGAERRNVVAMVVGRAGGLAVCGVAIGCVAAAIASRFVEGMLFAVSATDLATYVGVASGALATALIASWLPARRAARIQPVSALRFE
jgi:putative ABC transport system permease protein